MVYLNCAATSYRRPECVIEAVVRAMRELGSSGRGAAEGELGAARTVMVARERVASLLGFGHPERVVFAANATQALNMAILGTVRPGDRVVATDWDHNSVLRPLHLLAGRGAHVDFVPADALGRLDYDALGRLVAPGTRLVVCTHASNLTGNVADVRRFARVAHAAGALLLVDASQTAGAAPVDMEAMGADLLAFTGHKALMGPQGTGGLLVAPGVDVRPVISGGTGVLSFAEGMPDAYPEHLEAGTLNGHGIAGLSAAVDFVARAGVDAIHAHDLALTRRFVAGARKVPGAHVYGDWPEDLALLDGSTPARDHAPVVTLNIDGWESSELADALDEDFGIATRAGGHCAPRMHRALGTQDAGAVRFSFGYYTGERDVDLALEALGRLSAEARP